VKKPLIFYVKSAEAGKDLSHVATEKLSAALHQTNDQKKKYKD